MPSSTPIGTGDARASAASAVEIVVAERLLEEQQRGLARAVEIAARRGEREPAIGVGAERHVGPSASRTASVDGDLARRSA